MRTDFESLLSQRRVLLTDGATGTNLFAAGLEAGYAPELWNLEHPERISALHQSFIDAGSDLILTNSFGGNVYRLALHQAQDRVHELNLAAAELACEAAAVASRPVLVAGSIGPTGELIKPLGDLEESDAVAAFSEQAQGLVDGGCDVLWIETMSSREETEAAVRAAAAFGLPVACTLSFDTNGRTMMGISPSEFVSICRQIPTPPHAFGANCGLGPAEALVGLLSFSQNAAEQDVLVVKANCGLPAWVDGAIRYDGTPALMGDYAKLARDAGARIIGGCCGTSPEHVAAMRHALDDSTPGPAPGLEAIVAKLGEVSDGAKALGGSRIERTTNADDARRGRRPRRRKGA